MYRPKAQAICHQEQQRYRYIGQVHGKDRNQSLTTRTPIITDNKMARGKQKNLPNGNQDNLATPEPRSPTTGNSGMLNTPEKEDSDPKSYLKIIMEIFK